MTELTTNKIKKEIWHNVECIRDAAEVGKTMAGKVIVSGVGVGEQHKALMLQMMFENIAKQIFVFEPYITELESAVCEDECLQKTG